MNFSQEQLKSELVKRLASGQITREQAKIAVDRFRADQAAQETQQNTGDITQPAPQSQEKQALQEEAQIKQRYNIQDGNQGLSLPPNPQINMQGQLNRPQVTPFAPSGQIEGISQVRQPNSAEAFSGRPTFYDEVKEILTGAKRQTKETQELPDWGGMPMGSIGASIKSAFGTATGGQEDIADSLISNLPEGAYKRYDSKGNPIIYNPIDQQEYIIPPGFGLSDIPRIGLNVAQEALVGKGLGALGKLSKLGQASKIGRIGRAGIKEGLVAGATELGEELSGGSFDPYNVAIGAGMGGLTRGVIPEGAQQAAPKSLDQALTEELSPIAQKVSKGSSKAQKELVDYANINPETYKAAERLGVVDYIQPDHVSTNQAFIELQQLSKSQPLSPLRRQEKEGLREIGDRAKKMIENFGGVDDLGGLSDSIKQTMQSEVDSLKALANDAYWKLDNAVPKGIKIKGNQTKEYLENLITEYGGVDKLSPAEKKIYTALKEGSTYKYFDKLRRDIGVASRGGVFADADTAEARKLYSLMVEDQDRFLEGLIPQGDKALEQAKALVKARKGIEGDMQAIFGKNLDEGLVNKLLSGAKSLEKTDVDKFAKVMKAIPDQYKKSFVATGIMSAFGKGTQDGILNFNSFANWYNGINKSDRAKSMLFTNLPKEAKQVVNDLGTISNAIREATSQKITTGRALAELIKPAESFFKKALVNMAKVGAAGAAGAAVGGPAAFGTAGASIGYLIKEAVENRGKDQVKSFIDVLGSPEFKNLMAQSVEDSIKREKASKILAKSKKFHKFLNSIGENADAINAEQWILTGLRPTRELISDNIKGEEDGNK